MKLLRYIRSRIGWYFMVRHTKMYAGMVSKGITKSKMTDCVAKVARYWVKKNWLNWK